MDDSINNTDYPIPNMLNALILFSVNGSMIYALITIGKSNIMDFEYIVLTICFPLLFMCNYSIIHEACHNKLNSNKKLNYTLGSIASLLFPIPFSIIHKTHIGHHLRNRTDYEMFDLYYKNESILKKRIYWYSLLFGVHYFFMVIASLIALFVPLSLLARILKNNEVYAPFVDDLLSKHNLMRIRIEAITIIIIILFAFKALVIANLLPALFLSIFFWSTNQYLPHFYSKREIIEGGYNLSGIGPLGLIWLYREFDLNHHKNPSLPWIYLPILSNKKDESKNYFKQWIKQWKGPRFTTEIGPKPVTLKQLVNQQKYPV